MSTVDKVPVKRRPQRSITNARQRTSTRASAVDAQVQGRAQPSDRGAPARDGERRSERSKHSSHRKSDECFKLLVESVQDYAIYMLDPTGKISTWNVGAERIKGYPASEIIGEHVSRFYGEADTLARSWEHELATAAREGRVETEGLRIRKDGSQFWAGIVVTALRGPSGELIGFAKVTRDLTERRKLEQMQLDLIAQQRRVIRTLGVPIIEVWDKVLTVPMLGLVDSSRASELMEALLSEVIRKRARFAVLDLTGVEAVDTATAAHLLKLVDALRLLGAEGIVTGIQPAVAQTMVMLGVNTKTVKTLANLREALRYCMKWTGEPAA